MNSEKKIYFGPLDTLRACAFFIVFISHAYLSFFSVSDTATRYLAHGEVGVQIFFVLSAFLITYLSLSEYKKTGSFSIVHFFKKRILRIWPVYFLVLGVSYIWHALSASAESIGCTYKFLYFLGNTCMIEGIPNTVGSQTVGPLWSVSVEQQFYIIFPIALLAYIFLVKKIRPYILKSIVHVMFAGIFIYALYVRYIYAHLWEYISYSAFASLPAFIVGVYLAYAVYKRFSIVTHIQNNSEPYMVTAVVAFVSAFFIKFTGAVGVSLYILPIIYATVIFILLAIAEKVKVTNIITEHLGKISYGLYAYHMFAIVFLQYVFERTQPVFSSISSLVVTVILAQFSYTYIERFFLKFK